MLFSVQEACKRATALFSLHLWLSEIRVLSMYSPLPGFCKPLFYSLSSPQPPFPFSLSCSTAKRVKQVNLPALSLVRIISWKLVCPLYSSTIWSSQLFLIYPPPPNYKILPSKIGIEMQEILWYSFFKNIYIFKMVIIYTWIFAKFY